MDGETRVGIQRCQAEQARAVHEVRAGNTRPGGPLLGLNDWIWEEMELMAEAIRTFESGANRSAEGGKPDFEGFLHPLVIERYGEYMHKHRQLPNGDLRASDNWTKGIPRRQYVKSLFRHFMDVWSITRGHVELAREKDLEDSLCAVMFNAMGLLHEVRLGRDSGQ